nr:putative ribonuclease H-like domain-containing protein [Tanacetum cinerariifolium]
MTSLTSMCEVVCQIVQKKREEKQLEEEQAAKSQNWKLLVCYDDDDDEESSKSLEDNIISELPSYSTVIPGEPVDSLSMGDEHLNTVPAMEFDEFIKSCVENLVPNPSESEGENECDVPAGFTTFSNVLFDADYDFDSGDNQLILFSMSSPVNSLLKSIPLGIDETDCHPEKETRFTQRLLYDNSSPRLPKEIVSDNSNADIESFSPSPIPDEDSGSHMEEINLPFTPDDPMPPGIKDDDYDSGRDILILEELLDNYSLLLPANESYHFDIPSPYRPPAKPPDGNTGTLNIKMMGDVADQKVKIKREKEKIGTKLDQIKKKGKRGKARQLHMDLFGPTFVKSLNNKSYCLVVTDDYSRFTWVFFLATKDETSPILKTFITGLENQLSLKVKVIRSDNGTEFKNSDLNQFYEMKGIKRKFSVPRTPQQNGIADRKNKTIIEAARTMLADLLLPILF